MQSGERYETIIKFAGVFGFGIAIGFMLCTIYVHSRGTSIADLNRQQQSLTQELSQLQDSIRRERESIGRIQSGIGIAKDKIGEIRQGYDSDIERLQQSARILEQIRERPTKENPNP